MEGLRLVHGGGERLTWLNLRGAGNREWLFAAYESGGVLYWPGVEWLSDAKVGWLVA